MLLVGTLFFNVTTFRALQSGLDANQYDKLVWRPDALGCICFLVSGYLAYAEVCGGAFWTRRRGLDWKIAAWNFAGCVAFGIAAIASYWVPSHGQRRRPRRRQRASRRSAGSASSSPRC